ncbi:MAG TPA: hypothetical protein VFE42_22385, partial [Chloroflexota bacterium]|nr:hypothetical protein [Chloroflexota bacterium]
AYAFLIRACLTHHRLGDRDRALSDYEAALILFHDGDAIVGEAITRLWGLVAAFENGDISAADRWLDVDFLTRVAVVLQEEPQNDYDIFRAVLDARRSVDKLGTEKADTAALIVGVLLFRTDRICAPLASYCRHHRLR